MKLNSINPVGLALVLIVGWIIFSSFYVRSDYGKMSQDFEKCRQTAELVTDQRYAFVFSEDGKSGECKAYND